MPGLRAGAAVELQVVRALGWGRGLEEVRALAETIELRRCDPGTDGPFIRDSSRQNFFRLMSETVGWDEERHLREPVDPDSYRMVYRARERIGFFRTRVEADCYYLVTIQLIPEARGGGLGTYLMGVVEEGAREAQRDRIRLRVFRENPAALLYGRLGYRVVHSDEHSLLMEKRLDQVSSAAP